MKYKARPITSKACASPLKSDANLILGAADVGQSKRRSDYGKIMTEAMEGARSVNSRRSNYTPFDKTSESGKEDNNKE